MELDLGNILKKLQEQNPNATMNDVMGFLQMLLGGGMTKECTLSEEEKKKVLDGDVSIEGVVKNIKDYNNIIVMTGAGISVNAGIPDFRSPKTGLYDNLKEYGLDNPTDVFNISFFRKNPIPFFQLMKKLIPENKEFEPTKTHKFIKLLHDKGKLLRVYTQNIDGLEVVVGVPEEKVIEAHGHIRTASCIKCLKKFDVKEYKRRLYSDEIPIYCEVCKKENNGIVKPDVVFFGEGLPEKFYKNQSDDFEKCDLMIVMGTSLVVAPFCQLVNKCKDTVPRILFNMNKVGPWKNLSDNYRDVMMLGDCDVKTEEFCKLCGWKTENTEEEEESEGEK